MPSIDEELAARSEQFIREVRALVERLGPQLDGESYAVAATALSSLMRIAAINCGPAFKAEFARTLRTTADMLEQVANRDAH